MKKQNNSNISPDTACHSDNIKRKKQLGLKLFIKCMLRTVILFSYPRLVKTWTSLGNFLPSVSYSSVILNSKMPFLKSTDKYCSHPSSKEVSFGSIFGPLQISTTCQLQRKTQYWIPQMSFSNCYTVNETSTPICTSEHTMEEGVESL